MKIHSLLGACVLAAVASGANADIVYISGNSTSSTEHTGAQFDASLQYTFDAHDTGFLTITITNTTPNDIGGFLTGFVFDIVSIDSGEDHGDSHGDEHGHHDGHGHDGDLNIHLESASNIAFENTGEQSANPFGDFNAGAALNGNWSGGGNPSFGLAIGETGVFVFNIESDDAETITASTFLGDNGDRFAVRFSGLSNGASDKLLGSTLNVVPVPTAGLVGAGMLGLCLGVRTIRRR